MIRNLFLTVVAVALVAGSAEAGHALRLFALVELNPTGIGGTEPCGAPAPPRSVVEKFAGSEVVVVGKVTSVEKDVVEALAPYAGAKEKQKYKIAVVKIDTGLAGADKLKEIKVGFVVPPKVDPNMRPVRREYQQPDPKEGQEWLLFLAKHPTADFYIMSFVHLPVDLKNELGKKELEVAKRFASAIADPMKGLKSDKAEVRGETAAFLVIKYRGYPDFAANTDEIAIPADENKLILKGLTEADWRFQGERPAFTYAPLPYLAFRYLGLTEKDGWIDPMIAVIPGQPAPDYGLVMQDAFTKWLDGPGKKYQIKKVVATKAAPK